MDLSILKNKEFSMTISKAIKILDILIEQETILANGMADPQKSWNQDFDCLKDLAKTMADNTQNEIMALQLVKDQIIPKCKHPKDMQDRDSSGNLYCMECNWDL